MIEDKFISEILTNKGAHFDEPFYWGKEEFDHFITEAEKIGSSDIVLKAGDPISIRIDGYWIRVTEKIIDTTEVASIIDSISRSDSSSSAIMGGKDLDFSYEIKTGRKTKKRFRCNATAFRFTKDEGISITLRTIPDVPPTIEELGIEKELLEHAFPDKGLVLITGVMGSGKSTSLAAILRNTIETKYKNIITYESPIEFDLHAVPDKKSIVQQTEVPAHLSGGFDVSARNSARRAADIILIGESRDPETLKSMIEASEIGVCAYSTVHTRSVAETPSRIINVFKYEEQNQVASSLISALSLIVQQRLLPRADKQGRVALKEYLGFSQSMKRKLYQTKIEDLIPTIQDMVIHDGYSLLEDAEKKFKEGKIFEADYLSIKKEFEF